MLTMLTLLACGTPAVAGDLWVTVEGQTTDGRVTLHLPASALVDETEPEWIETARGRIDLAAEARALKRDRPGGRRTYDIVHDGEITTVTLSHEALGGPPATQLALEALGPLGNGLTVTFPLDVDALGQARSQADATVGLDGLAFDGLDLDEEVCAQLRRSPPVTLVVVDGPKGGTFRLSTR